MKALEDLHVCVVDYGSFLSLAECLARTYSRVDFHSPCASEFLDASTCVCGDGLEKVHRVDEWMDPDYLKTLDCVIFPDRGMAGEQKLLRSMGIPVWGSFYACELEEYRTRFLKLLKTLDMPVINSVTIRGVTALAEHLKSVENKHVKINRFRQVMETWHHIDYQHSERELERLAHVLGPLKDSVVFVVQDHLETDVEVGYDGWCIDGDYPEESFAGYEAKNELYLGARRKYSELPEAVRYVNEKFSPVLKGYGYRNFWATEIRMKDDVPHFIDPTGRMPGQTGEQIMETCANLPEIIWKGAQGELVKPDYLFDFAAEATLHYTAGGHDSWKTVNVPDKIAEKVKLYHHCCVDGAFHIPPGKNDEIGVIVGTGNSIEEAITDLRVAALEFGDEPVCIHEDGFIDLIESIKKAEEEGVVFSDQKPPDPSVVLEEVK